MLCNTPYLLMPRNDLGRDFVIGDLHGCLHMLTPLLEKVRFDTTVDRLFSVGDLIHRGPSSMDCLLLAEKPWFHPVRGNHEAIQLGAWQDHILHDQSLRSMCRGSGGADLLEWDIDMKRLGSIIESLPLAIEFPLKDGRRVGLIHAGISSPDRWQDVQAMKVFESRLYSSIRSGLQPDLLWDRSAAYATEAILAARDSGKDLFSIDARRRWAFHRGTRPIDGIDLLVAGHTSIRMQTPVKAGKRLFMDTGAGYNGGPLSMLELDTGRFWSSPDLGSNPEGVVTEHPAVLEVNEDPAWLTPDERKEFDVKD